MVKVNYESITGEIIGYYPNNISYLSIPEPYIQIDEITHRDCIQNPGLRKVDTNTLTIVEYTPPGPTTEERLVSIRHQRNALLTESDWTQLPDSQLTIDQKQAWAEYRQALRDFPGKCDPANPVWPEKPLAI